MRYPIPLLVAAAIAFGGSSPLRAESPTFFTIGPEVSTLGLGGEVGVRINDFFGLRVGGNYFETSFDGSYASTNYDLDFLLESAGAVIDIYPLGGGFRLSAGLRWNGNKVGLSATPSVDTVIGGVTFTPAQLGTLSGDLDFEDFAPFAGIGYQSDLLSDRLRVAFGLGLFFQGDPSVNLNASGTFGGAAALQDALRQEESDLEDDLQFLGIYPVLSLAATLHF